MMQCLSDVTVYDKCVNIMRALYVRISWIQELWCQAAELAPKKVTEWVVGGYLVQSGSLGKVMIHVLGWMELVGTRFHFTS